MFPCPWRRSVVSFSQLWLEGALGGCSLNLATLEYGENAIDSRWYIVYSRYIWYVVYLVYSYVVWVIRIARRSSNDANLSLASQLSENSRVFSCCTCGQPCSSIVLWKVHAPLPRAVSHASL